jgi:transcription-repair coupling factor (superfamily II helicase)
VGFDLYCQLLKQSVSALKGEKVKPRTQVSIRLDFLNIGEAPVEDVPAPDAADDAPFAGLPKNYVPEPQHRIEIYRKVAQADGKESLEALKAEVRDRFGPVPRAVELLLQVAELKLVAGERGVTMIEVRQSKLMLTRHRDLVTAGGMFPRLKGKGAPARLKEIRKLVLGL